MRDERNKLQKELGYNRHMNFVGPESLPWLRYYKWLPFWKYLNWPAFLHDCRYDQNNRTTYSNKMMARDYAQELILEGGNGAEILEPYRFKFVFGMVWFYLIIFPAITIVGRIIDKG